MILVVYAIRPGSGRVGSLASKLVYAIIFAPFIFLLIHWQWEPLQENIMAVRQFSRLVLTLSESATQDESTQYVFARPMNRLAEAAERWMIRQSVPASLRCWVTSGRAGVGHGSRGIDSAAGMVDADP